MEPKGSLLHSQAPTMVPNLGQMKPVHTFPPYFPKIHSHSCLGHLSGLFSSGFSTKILYAYLISLMHTTYSTHFIIILLITLKIFVEV